MKLYGVKTVYLGVSIHFFLKNSLLMIFPSVSYLAMIFALNP